MYYIRPSDISIFNKEGSYKYVMLMDNTLKAHSSCLIMHEYGCK